MAGVKKMSASSSSSVDRSGPPRMPHNILFKLFGFTFLLFTLPVLSFFMSQNFLFKKNGEIFSGIIAVVMANLVLLFYICMIFKEEEVEAGVAIRNGKDPKMKEKDDKAEEEKSEKNSNASAAGVRKRK